MQKRLTMHKGCLKQLVLQQIQLHKCDSVPVPLFKSNCTEQLTQPAYKTLPIQRTYLHNLICCSSCYFVPTILKLLLQGEPLLIGQHQPPHWAFVVGFSGSVWSSFIQLLVSKNSLSPTIILFARHLRLPLHFQGWTSHLSIIWLRNSMAITLGMDGFKALRDSQGVCQGTQNTCESGVACDCIYTSSLDYLLSY